MNTAPTAFSQLHRCVCVCVCVRWCCRQFVASFGQAKWRNGSLINREAVLRFSIQRHLETHGSLSQWAGRRRLVLTNRVMPAQNITDHPDYNSPGWQNREREDVKGFCMQTLSKYTTQTLKDKTKIIPDGSLLLCKKKKNENVLLPRSSKYMSIWVYENHMSLFLHQSFFNRFAEI